MVSARGQTSSRAPATPNANSTDTQTADLFRLVGLARFLFRRRSSFIERARQLILLQLASRRPAFNEARASAPTLRQLGRARSGADSSLRPQLDDNGGSRVLCAILRRIGPKSQSTGSSCSRVAIAIGINLCQSRVARIRIRIRMRMRMRIRFGVRVGARFRSPKRTRPTHGIEPKQLVWRPLLSRLIDAVVQRDHSPPPTKAETPKPKASERAHDARSVPTLTRAAPRAAAQRSGRACRKARVCARVCRLRAHTSSRQQIECRAASKARASKPRSFEEGASSASGAHDATRAEVAPSSHAPAAADTKARMSGSERASLVSLGLSWRMHLARRLWRQATRQQRRAKAPLQRGLNTLEPPRVSAPLELRARCAGSERRASRPLGRVAVTRESRSRAERKSRDATGARARRSVAPTREPPTEPEATPARTSRSQSVSIVECRVSSVSVSKTRGRRFRWRDSGSAPIVIEAASANANAT